MFNRSSRSIRLVLTLFVGLVVAATLAACGTDIEATGGSETSDAKFQPVTIKHAFGTTEITSEPQRVVAWGWGAADAILAVGVVPVGIPQQAYGGDKNGVLPWIAEDLQAKGVKTPKVLPDDGKTLPMDEIIALDPDLFVAPYSGLTRKQYDDLVALGIDVIAYPQLPWATPWRDVITTVGKALGKSDEAAKVLTDLDAEVARQAEAHPEFKGKTIAAITKYDGIAVYLPIDPRVQLLEDLGFTSAPSVEKLAPPSAQDEEEAFYYTLPYENSDKLTSDILLNYSDTRDAEQNFLRSAPIRAMDQSKADTVASIVGPANVASVSPPTALSLTWGLENLVTKLSAAAAKVH